MSRPLRSYASADNIPPSYDDFSTEEYGALQATYEFQLASGHLKNKTTWLTWKLQTPGLSKPKAPRYLGGDCVQGQVEVRLDRPLSINSIYIVLRGRLITSIDDSFIFFEKTHSVWSRSDGDPRILTTAVKPNFDGKLVGNFDRLFSFAFPTDVNLSALQVKGKKLPGRPGVICSMPQTLREIGVATNVEYDLSLYVSYGGILKTDSKIKTPVLFVPAIIPEPPSELRMLAYEEETPLPGPQMDPVGWKVFPSVTFSGLVKKQTRVNFKYTMSLAQPLSYTIGTAIPCHLELACQDAKALDFLSKPKYQNIRLLRRVQFFLNPSKSLEQHLAKLDEGVDSPRGSSSRRGPALMVEEDDVEVGVFWSDSEDWSTSPDDWYTKCLAGEIHLSKTLLASSDFTLCSVEYFVQILPFDTDAFRYSEPPSRSNSNSSSDSGPSKDSSDSDIHKHSEPEEIVLQSIPVTIATFHPRGPKPRVYSERPEIPPKRRRPKSGQGDTLYRFNFESGASRMGAGIPGAGG